MFEEKREEKILRMVNGRRGAPELSLTFISSILFLSFSAAADDPAALLRRAERVKDAWPEVVLTLRVTTTKPGAAPVGGTFSVEAKGRDKSRIRFLNPSDAGKSVVQVGDDVWLVLPNTRNPIRVPKSHRLAGGFSAADMARTRFAEDYDAVLERTDVLNGLNCAVLRLTAKGGKSPSYPIVRVWIDEKEALYRKAVFLVSSGKTARETAFDEYRPFHGVLSLAKMTIVDALRPGTTVVEYLDYEKKNLPDTLFEVRVAPPP
ncbi:MAG TPA: outer membrane lipoprotein-sorting protein [Thermoanaerobaculia bacterium]|nr:outer membrane lipoprotein-sorting protein [Thermoanaerobaculia bacterium]